MNKEILDLVAEIMRVIYNIQGNPGNFANCSLEGKRTFIVSFRIGWGADMKCFRQGFYLESGTVIYELTTCLAEINKLKGE